MPKYKVRSTITHGTLDDEGNAQQQDYAAGDEIELEEDQAQPLLEAGVITRGDDAELDEKEQRIAEIETKAEELREELQVLQQEAKDAREALSRDPGKEYGTLVADPSAAPPKPGDGEAGQYNEQSRAELVQEAKNRGLNAGGTKGDLVNRLEANDREQGGQQAQPTSPQQGQQQQQQ